MVWFIGGGSWLGGVGGLGILALAGPPDLAVEDEAAIGIVWHGEATGRGAIRQRVIDALARTGREADKQRTVIDRADQRARVRVALDLPRAQAEVAVRLAEGLADATMRFRGGDLVAADEAVAGVLDALAAEPVLPGAAELAFTAHVLRAQIAWTSGETELPRQYLRRAVVLDPEGKLSTRRVPPAIATLHGEVQAQVLAELDAWLPIEVDAPAGTGPVVVEIDGRPGRRRVPSGEHWVVVRRPGRPAVGFVVEAGGKVVVPDQGEQVRAGLPVDRDAAETICRTVDVERLVLAEARDDRLALEGYACGEGFTATWYSEPWTVDARPVGPPPIELEAGAAIVLGTPTEDSATLEGSRLAAREPWPEPAPEPDQVDGSDGSITEPPPKKPWFRRVWVWSLIGGVVAAGVTTGAVLGTRQQPSEIRVDVETFRP